MFSLFLGAKNPEFQGHVEKNLKVIWKSERHFTSGVFDEILRKERIKLIAHTDIFLDIRLHGHGMTRI